MDSFFKAAVCDLDKLLDDFELNTDELDCKSVSLTPPAYPFSLLGSQSFSPETPTVPQTLPDLNSLHYGSAPSCPDPPASHHHHHSSSVDGELKGQPLTGVDLLSSVDRRPAKASTPPCPDRALKPVCDLVSDTSSAILVRANSHDAFGELDAAEKQLEEEGALLVDFDSPLVVLPGEESGGLGPGTDCRDAEGKRARVAEAGLLGLDPGNPVDGYSASLSLLDVILPAAAGCESGDDALLQKITKPVDREDGEVEEVACMDQTLDSSLDFREQVHALPLEKEESPVAANEQDKTEELSDLVEAESPKSLTLESEPVGLSCLPIAVSMCGALVKPKQATDETPQGLGEDDQTGSPENTESDSASEALEDKSHQVESSDISVIDNNIPSLSSVDSSLVAENPSIYQEVADVSVSQWEDRVSPEERPSSSESPVDLSAETTLSNNPEPSSVDPPEFGYEYLSESNQAELVTDEELDAFLRSQAEAEHGEGASYCNRSGDWGQDEGFSELNGDLEDRLAEEELSSCGQGRREQLEGPASAESGRTVRASAEGSSNLAPTAPSHESPKSCQLEAELEALSVNHSSDGSPTQSQPIGSPDQQHCYGGARPKQLHCQVSPSPPTAEAGEEEREPMPSGFSAASCAVEEEENSSPSPSSPNPVDQPHNSSEPRPTYSPQEQCETSVSVYDELSEPPPYPGEPSREGVRSENERGEHAEGLGSKQPDWVPDSAAPNCMNCWQKFTFTKRRHHCRACGKVYCAVCCSRKCKLKYLEKEARVCVTCFNTIHRAQAREHMMSPTGPSPNPNVPSEYCSTIPPLQQARAAGTLNSPPPTVMVPVSVLKQPSNDGCPREQKRVWFADGILPNGEVADTTRLSVSGRRSSQESSPVTPEPPTAGPGGSEGGSGGGSSAPEAPGTVEMVRPLVTGPWDYALLCGVGASVQQSPSLLPEDEEGLPPLLITTGEDEAGGDVLVEERPAPCQIMLLLEEGGPRPLTFALNANLLVNVKLVTYCGRRCWCFSSSGLQALGQRELLFVLECLPDERALPKDLFTLCLSIYQDAQKGKFIEDLGNVTFTSSFLGSKEHGGMLFFLPSCQPLEGLAAPPQPYLCGLLIQRLEVPWAKVFPLRLLLRLGAEKNVYPTTLVSVRFRDSMYRETGHTIMNLLADLRNYQYSLPSVEGLRIHMEMGHSYINIPKSSFNEMLKVVNASNEHVISVGATFSLEADSHLVCFQNEEGNYQTQASSKPGKTRTVTGASFVVFNGALKASSGFIAKSSIVEDGLMVQIPPDTMEALRTALREQTDFLIPCGRNDGGELRENVTVRWVDWAAPVNAGVTSAVDGRPLDGVHSVRMQQDTEFESEGRAIRCTEVFYQLKEAGGSLASVLASCGVFQREMALAACGALAPHLAVLAAAGINSLSLRVSTQADMVEYQAGSGGRLLPQRYMNELDSALIPVIHGGSASVPQTAMDVEFLLYITRTV